MNTNMPFSPSADRNKGFILDVLKQELEPGQTVLEIGSGTGQHVCHFAANLPDINWQPSELAANVISIKTRLHEHDLGNVMEPVELDVDSHPWRCGQADVCYSCNTFHIISLESIQAVFHGCDEVLGRSGKLCVYGPFSVAGTPAAESNLRFDQMLRSSDPLSGLRDIQELDDVAQEYGFARARFTEMPMNNLMVVWER